MGNTLTPTQQYQKDLQQPGFHADARQAFVVEHCQRFYDELLHTPVQTPGLLSRLLKQRCIPVKGLYLWGGVGRGKTYLMDLLFNSLPIQEKSRLHFQDFMQNTHNALQHLPKSPDPLQIIAKQIRRETRALFVDEFHVDDITDAMILAGLLRGLFVNGVSLITTSNIPPDDLYRNGLQRDRFLPAIDLLHDHTDIVQLDHEKDFRMHLAQTEECYLINPAAGEATLLDQHFTRFAEHGPVTYLQPISLNKRPIDTLAVNGQAIWLSFDAICNTPRSSTDYIALAKTYPTVLLEAITPMSDGQNDIAKRFIQLIDALYDHHVQLILSSPVEPADLYTGSTLAFEFERTVSRLFEMRSEGYRHKPHRQ